MMAQQQLKHVGDWIFLITTYITRQTMYERNAEARSSNHCCNGKAISILSVSCVQHAMRMRNIVICSLPGYT